jgi:hypothetical protein
LGALTLIVQARFTLARRLAGARRLGALTHAVQARCTLARRLAGARRLLVLTGSFQESCTFAFSRWFIIAVIAFIGAATSRLKVACISTACAELAELAEQKT